MPSLLFFVFLFGERINYWNLGISINDESTIIVQKKVDLNNFYADPASYQKKTNSSNPIYTLKTNYIMEPTFINGKEENNYYEIEEQNIKNLILNQQYFEAAKHILQIEENQISNEFANLDDFYYWTGFVFYHLGNYDEAYNNIQQISNFENSEQFFLQALILKDSGRWDEASILLKQIIDTFPNDDYTDYAKNLLIEYND